MQPQNPFRVGAVVRSTKFANGLRPYLDQQVFSQVGYPAEMSDDVQPERADTNYLIVFAPEQSGNGPGASRLITALPIDIQRCSLSDAGICFETAGISTEKVRPEDITVLGQYDLNPLNANCNLTIKASSKEEATGIAGNVFGFLPTMEAVQGDDGWHISGYQYHSIRQHDAILAQHVLFDTDDLGFVGFSDDPPVEAAPEEPIAENASPQSELAALEQLLCNAVTRCLTVLFGLEGTNLTIEQIQSAVPGLVIIAQVRSSYGVSVPVSDGTLGAFAQFGELPDPADADLDALTTAVREKLRKGFFTD